jgi:hypothetical protein
LGPSACLICDPVRARDRWSFNDGVSCDDEQFCTVDDACSAGTCSGAPRQCDDGIACNGVSTCDEQADACTPLVNLCGEGELCGSDGSCVTTCDGCAIAGNCVASGEQQPGNACQVCDPARSTTDYVAAPDGAGCSDDQACTLDDTCLSGVCAPGAPISCPTGFACDPNSGDCACQAGLARCNGNQLETCIGGSFQLAEDCGEFQVCDASQARCTCTDDADPSTTLIQHQSFGCGFLRSVGSERWVSFSSGVQFDPDNGFAWVSRGFLTLADTASDCAALDIGGITGWSLPRIDDVRSLIAGCAGSVACPLSDPACLSSSCGQCDSCRGSEGPNDGEYCRPVVPICVNMHTRSTCPDCPAPAVEWNYVPVNGNFLASDPTDRITGYCFHAGLSL